MILESLFRNPTVEEKLFYVINALKACKINTFAHLVTMGECLGTVLHPDVESRKKINFTAEDKAQN